MTTTPCGIDCGTGSSRERDARYRAHVAGCEACRQSLDLRWQAGVVALAREESERAGRLAHAHEIARAELLAAGFCADGETDSGSRYYRRGLATIRVSDHRLPPMTALGRPRDADDDGIVLVRGRSRRVITDAEIRAEVREWIEALEG
jgi:hypothetical protein